MEKLVDKMYNIVLEHFDLNPSRFNPFHVHILLTVCMEENYLKSNIYGGE